MKIGLGIGITKLKLQSSTAIFAVPNGALQITDGNVLSVNDGSILVFNS